MRKFYLTIFCQLFMLPYLFAQLGTGLPESFTRKDSLRGTLSSIRNNYDVKFYNLDIKIDIENRFISGFNEITFIAKEDLTEIQVDLFDNMKINKITYNSTELKYKREFNAVFISFNKKIVKGTNANIRVYYEGNPMVAKRAPWDGGFVFKKDKNGNPHVGVACQGTGASLWWPNKDHQSDEPDSMAINITSSSLYEEVSNGRLRAKKDLGNGFTRFEWFVAEPINNYNVSVNIADYYHWTDTYTSKIDNEILTLDYYVLKDDQEKAKKQFEQVKPMMDAFEKRFGKYAFYKDGYKLVQTPYLGMEHQSCVAYGNGYKNGYLGFDLSGSGEGMKFDYIIIHETAHEWWGNNVTSYDIADMWIHEGFGQYSEVVYLEDLHGRESANKYLNGIKRGVSNKEAVIGPYGVNKEGSGDMYPKGALFLNTLRSCINNDIIWWDIVKSIQTEYRHKNISTNDVLNLMNKKSGKDLTVLFDQYLKYPNLPELMLNSKTENNNLILSYQWKTDVNNFNMPVDIIVKGEKQRIYPTNAVQTKSFEMLSAEDLVVDKTGFYIKVSQEK